MCGEFHVFTQRELRLYTEQKIPESELENKLRAFSGSKEERVYPIESDSKNLLLLSDRTVREEEVWGSV